MGTSVGPDQVRPRSVEVHRIAPAVRVPNTSPSTSAERDP